MPTLTRIFLTSFVFLAFTIVFVGPSARSTLAQGPPGRRSEGNNAGRREGRGGGSRGERPAPPKPPTTAAPAPKPTTSPSNSSSMDYNEYAKGLVKQYDKNGNGMLEPDEQRELRGKAAQADLNKDGVITREELVAHLSAPPSSASTPSAPTPAPSGSETPTKNEPSADKNQGADKATSGKRTGNRVFTALAENGSSKSEKVSRRSYRFTPAAERLSSGLPDWFTSRDKNHDGQVSMHEYSRTWSDRTAAEFRRYDLDNDGMITAKEATKNSKAAASEKAKAEEKPEKPA